MSDPHKHSNGKVQYPARHQKNLLRRYGKPGKPRKDWHQKLFKNPPENIVALAAAAQKKSLMSLPRLFVLGVLGGIYVGFGGMFSTAVAGGLDPSFAASFPGIQKILVGLTFPTALVYIIVAGGELFTGNVMYSTLGMLSKQASGWRMFWLTLLSFFSNYLGTVLVAGFSVNLGDFFQTPPYSTFLQNLALNKVTSPSFGILVLRAIPANMCVNIAIIMASAAEDITGKVVAAYMPIATFATIGMEHIIANDFFIHAAIFSHVGVPYGTWIWKNLIAVTIGNAIGAMVIGAAYWYVYMSDWNFGKLHWSTHFHCCCPGYHKEASSSSSGDVEAPSEHNNEELNHGK